MKRIQVQNPITPEPIAPAAQPVNTYYKPKLAEPVLTAIADLSPLSSTLAEIEHDQRLLAAKKEGAAGKAAGEALTDDELTNLLDQNKSLDDAKAAVQKTQESYAKKIADGSLPAYASPFFSKTFMETVGRRAGLKYANALEGKLAEASSATDANGDPLPLADLAKIKEDAWKQFGASPLLKDRYANQSALAIKAEADTRFESAVSQARGQNKLEFTRQEATNELAQHLKDTWTDPKFTPDDMAIAKVWDFSTERVRMGNIGDPMGIVVNAVTSVAAQEAAEVGPEQAARFLRNATKIRVGNTTLEKDTKSSGKLANLIASYEDQADREVTRASTRMNAGVSKAIRDAQDAYMKQLLLVSGTGASAEAELNKTFDADLTSARFGEFTPQAMDSLRVYAKSLDNSNTDKGEALYNGLLYRIAQGEDMDTINGDINNLVQGNQLSAKWAADLLNKSNVRRDLSPYLENNGAYRRAVSDIEQSNTIRGLPELAQRDLDGFARNLQESFETEAAQKAAEFSKPNGGGTAAFDQWAGTRKKEIVAQMAAKNQEISTKREGALKEIETAIDHGHSVDNLLERYGSVIPVEHSRSLKERGDRAADKSEYFTLPDFRNSSAILSATVKKDLGENLEEGGLDLLRFDIKAQTDLRTRSEAWLSANQDKMTTAQLKPAFAVALRDEILPASQKYLNNLRPEVSAIVDANKAKQVASQTYASNPKQFASTVTSDGVWNPLLSDSYKEIVKGYLDGSGTGLWGNALAPEWRNTFSIDKKALIDAADTELRFNLGDASSEMRSQAVVDAYGTVGLLTVDNVLSGKATIWVPEARLESYDRASNRARDMIRDFGGITNEAEVENILWNRDLNSNPVPGLGIRTQTAIKQARVYSKGVREKDPARSVDISKTKINGYTTPLWDSVGAFKNWYDAADPKTLKTLLSRLGVPLDEKEVKEWYKLQSKAIERIQDAR